MTRCDSEVTFYRIFCLSLLGLAISFTLILTDVFVDIDGLFSDKIDTPKKLGNTIPRQDKLRTARHTQININKVANDALLIRHVDKKEERDGNPLVKLYDVKLNRDGYRKLYLVGKEPKKRAKAMKRESEENNGEGIFIVHDTTDIIDNLRYMKKYPKEEKFQNRDKRNVKNKENNHEGINKHKKSNDILVEIETRLDGKGYRAEERKNVINELVSKIKRALTSHPHTKSNDVLKPIRYKRRPQNAIEARPQNPLENLIDRRTQTYDSLERKSVRIPESLDLHKDISIRNPFETTRKRAVSALRPKSNSNNNGKHGLVGTDYAKQLELSRVPQRLQHPINTNTIDPSEDAKNYVYDAGGLKYYVKEIADTGFSIGFNQYVGDAPDLRNVNQFNGFDPTYNTYPSDTNPKNRTNFAHELFKRDIKFAGAVSDKKLNDINDDYNILFDDIYPPLHNNSLTINDDDNLLKQLSKNILGIPLNPTEILRIADQLNRKKRSHKMTKKIYYVNKRQFLTRIINSKKSSKLIKVQRKNRSKRNIDKVRAEEALDNTQDNNAEEPNYFDDGEKLSDQKAKDTEVEPEVANEKYDGEANNQMLKTALMSPVTILEAHVRHNPLLHKYPHLFVDKMMSEEDDPEFYGKLIAAYEGARNSLTFPTLPVDYPFPVTETNEPYEAYKHVEPSPKYKNMEPSPEYKNVEPPPKYENVEPPLKYKNVEHSPKYKVSIKITPKNNTGTTGFKHVHTVINKAINRNGLRYHSQLNISELSKVEPYNGYDPQFHKSHVYTQYFPINNLRNMTNPATHIQRDTPTPVHHSEGTGPRNKSFFQNLQEQQDKIKLLLQQHRKRIENKLHNLRIEKYNIERLLIPGVALVATTATERTTATPMKSTSKIIPITTSALPATTAEEYIEVVLPFNPPQVLRLNKIEAGELITNALFKLQSAPDLNDVPRNRPPTVQLTTVPTTTTTTTSTTTPITTTPTTTTPTTTTPTTTVPTATVPTTTATTDTERVRMLQTLKRNEDLTNLILYKVDHSTSLLKKLTKVLEAVTMHKPDQFQKQVYPNTNMHEVIINQKPVLSKPESRDPQPVLTYPAVAKDQNRVVPRSQLHVNYLNKNNTLNEPAPFSFYRPLYVVPSNANEKNPNMYQQNVQLLPKNQQFLFRSARQDNKQTPTTDDNFKVLPRMANPMKTGSKSYYFLDTIDNTNYKTIETISSPTPAEGSVAEFSAPNPS